MPVYRTKFARANFTFEPPIRQSADVVFVCDAPNDDEHWDEIHDAAWTALQEQMPHWKDQSCFPIEGYGGWSSVIGGLVIEEVVDADLDLCLGVLGQGKPRICETFTVDGRGYRVTSFYKTWTPDPPTEPGEIVAHQIVADIRREEYEKMSPAQKAQKDREIRIIKCSREEAEFVSGDGVSGIIRRIEDVQITGLVNWDARVIAKERQRYRGCAEYPVTTYRYWD